MNFRNRRRGLFPERRERNRVFAARWDTAPYLSSSGLPLRKRISFHDCLWMRRIHDQAMWRRFYVVISVALFTVCDASQAAEIQVDFGKTLGPMRIERMALG